MIHAVIKDGTVPTTANELENPAMNKFNCLHATDYRDAQALTCLWIHIYYEGLLFIKARKNAVYEFIIHTKRTHIIF